MHRIIGSLVIVLGIFLFGWSLVRPSNNRDWALDQAVLPTASFDGDLVHVRNIRDATYRSASEYDLSYFEKTYDLSKMESLWYVVEPFSQWEGAAHTFLTFGFEGGEYVGISVEIRKEKGEEFSALKGLLKRYEIMYVVATERDLIGLRANHRKDDIFVFPAKASKEQIRTLFTGMIERANTLAAEPEFYHSLTNTCTTNIVRHVNTLVPGRIPLRLAVLLPGYSDKLAYELGLIDTNVSLEQLRERYKVNEKAAQHADDPDFSRLIRSEFGDGL